MLTTVTIGNTPTLIVPADSAREELVIQNTSDADVFLNFTGSQDDLTLDNGFKLSPGDAASLTILPVSNKGSYGMVTNAIYGIAAVAGKIVRVMAQ